MDFDPNPDFAGFLQLVSLLLIVVGFVGLIIELTVFSFRHGGDSDV